MKVERLGGALQLQSKVERLWHPCPECGRRTIPRGTHGMVICVHPDCGWRGPRPEGVSYSEREPV